MEGLGRMDEQAVAARKDALHVMTQLAKTTTFQVERDLDGLRTQAPPSSVVELHRDSVEVQIEAFYPAVT